MNKEFNSREAVSYGWVLTKRHFFSFALLLLVSLVIMVARSNLNEFGEKLGFFLGNPFRLIAWLLSTLAGLIITWVTLRLHDGKVVDLGGLFSSLPRLINFALSQLLYQLIIIGGTILLVIPAVIWAIRFQFAGFVTLDEGLGPIAALKRSSALTQGAREQLFWFLLLAIGINCLGALALVLGLFWSIPTSLLATAWIYRKLQRETPAPTGQTPPMANQSAAPANQSTAPANQSSEIAGQPPAIE